jgi:plasmid stabilization system protein ParE
LRYSARAHAQLIAISDYIHERNPNAAARVGEAIREAAELLRYFPYAAQVGRSPGTREWVVRGLPYIIVYEVNAEANALLSWAYFTVRSEEGRGHT